MSHDYRHRRKADRPILFRAPTAQAVPVPPVEDAPDVEKEIGTQPGAFDLRQLCVLLWWVQQQVEAEAAAQAAEPIIVESTPVEDITSRSAPRRRRALPWLVLAGCGLCLLALLSFVVGAWLSATTTVTLIPTEATLGTTTSVTIATGHAKATGQTIPGRLLSTLTLSQARSAPTTGIGHQHAQAAHGRVTFYNASLVAQTIPAGTQLIGADSTEVVTDQEAVIPAAQLPTEGQATVSAHAVQNGPQGNIGAGDLHGACCRENVFVQNGAAFTGGQNAYAYPMVTRHDLDIAVVTLTTAMDTSIQAAYSTQLATNEALVTPVPCTPRVASPFHVGDEAQAITVTLTDTCTGVAYDQQALQAMLLAHMSEQAQARVGLGSLLLGDLQVTTKQVKQQGGTFTLTVQSTGVWSHEFSQAELQHFTALIAGKSAQRATTVLLHQPGVSEVALGASTLPSNRGQIRILVLYRPA